MKKIFEEAVIEVITLELQDVIATSGDAGINDLENDNTLNDLFR